MTNGCALPPLRTGRVILRNWRPQDRAAFRSLCADPVVMEHFPSTLSAAEADTLADRIEAGLAERGWGLWALEVPGLAEFGGFVGLSVPAVTMPFGPCVEVAWRLDRSLWGKGLASEAALAALDYGFATLGLAEIVSFTAMPNLRSQAVMRRIGMEPDGEFDHPVLPDGHRLRRHVLYRKTAP